LCPQDNVCPLTGSNSEIMQCNASEAIWPDIQMHFDGCRTSQSARPTMSDQSTLQMVPHPCDMDYMHWAVDGKRLEVCSGYQGQTMADVYMSYALDSQTDTWAGAASQVLLGNANATYWMRTYEEESGILQMGNIMSSPAFNNTLGFLGGQLNASNPVLSSLPVPGGVHFFRCADRLACQMPEYFYGGVRKDPRLNLQTGQNFSEMSLRPCGSIGTLYSETTCRLDVELFPLFAYLYQNAAENSVRGCFAIWPVQDFLFTSKLVLPLPVGGSDGLQMAANPQSLFCVSAPQLMCLYGARATSVLQQDASKTDSVSSIIKALNSMFLQTTSRIQAQAMSSGTMATYEDINICAQSVFTYTLSLQSRIQVMYESSVTSGFYLASQLSLYEFSQQWFHQCMLNVLLSTLDPAVVCPDTSQLLSAVPIPLDLWSSQRRSEICDPQRLQLKSGLHYIVCSMMHPTYTLSESSASLPASIINQIYQQILNTANNELYENQKSSVLSCFSTAAWNLPLQTQSLLAFYEGFQVWHF